jgi:hypothetical protein
MTPRQEPGPERVAPNLSLRDWLVVLLLITALCAAIPLIPFRSERPDIDRDYRIPFNKSNHYDLYHRFTTLAAAQFPTLLVGDSVVWGQFADRHETLSHYLNDRTAQPRYVNAGVDGMHPIALEQLLEHHATAIQKKDVVLQMNPLWLMIPKGRLPRELADPLQNRPGLVPRLAASPNGTYQEAIEAALARALDGSPIDRWIERVADSRVDFLDWTVDHPYESPVNAMSAGLPASDDTYAVKKIPWKGTESAKLDYGWPILRQHPQWKAFERILGLLQARQNRILVLLGPMNEHMMKPTMLEGYLRLKKEIEERVVARGIACVAAPKLDSTHYSDICHPLAAGYKELAKELLRSHSAWLLDSTQSR